MFDREFVEQRIRSVGGIVSTDAVGTHDAARQLTRGLALHYLESAVAIADRCGSTDSPVGDWRQRVVRLEQHLLAAPPSAAGVGPALPLQIPVAASPPPLSTGQEHIMWSFEQNDFGADMFVRSVDPVPGCSRRHHWNNVVFIHHAQDREIPQMLNSRARRKTRLPERNGAGNNMTVLDRMNGQ